MAVFIPSTAYLTQSLDLTATPQLMLTNSSTFNASSSFAAVTAQEVSGFGYARANLTVDQNGIDSRGYGTITYLPASFTASGGTITFDRVVLLADSEFVGWAEISENIIDGDTRAFNSIGFYRSAQGEVFDSNGQDAFSSVFTNFTQPAVTSTVNVTLFSSNFLAVGAIVYIYTGGYYEVMAILSAQQVTLKNLGYSANSTPGSTILAGSKCIVSGIIGPESESSPSDQLYTLGLNLGGGSVAAGEFWTDTALLHNATEFYIADTDRSGVYSGILDRLEAGTILKLVGQSSGSIHYFSIIPISYGAYHVVKAFLWDRTGTATDGEVISVSFIPSGLQVYVPISTTGATSSRDGQRYFIDASARNITRTLPLAASVGDRFTHTFKRIDDGTAGYTVTIARSGSDLIDGETSQTLDAYEAFELHSDGVSNWWIL